MRIFKNRWFCRFAEQQEIDDDYLRDAVQRAERGLIDADLGGGVIKQRIARPNRGRSGGYRAIILFRVGENAYFVYGFPKNVKDSLGPKELKAFRIVAQQVSSYSHAEIEKLLRLEELVEVEVR